MEKKDGFLCSCINYRGLNQVTVKNKYPLLLISSAFEPIHGDTIFIKLDLHNDYHLLWAGQGAELKTTFKTPIGHYDYMVIPFSLCNAPSFFQALITYVRQDFLNTFVFVYFDDILIYSKIQSDHSKHICMVLQHLLENKLYDKAEKCEWHKSSVTFLGHIL